MNKQLPVIKGVGKDYLKIQKEPGSQSSARHDANSQSLALGSYKTNLNPQKGADLGNGYRVNYNDIKSLVDLKKQGISAAFKVDVKPNADLENWTLTDQIQQTATRRRQQRIERDVKLKNQMFFTKDRPRIAFTNFKQHCNLYEIQREQLCKTTMDKKDRNLAFNPKVQPAFMLERAGSTVFENSSMPHTSLITERSRRQPSVFAVEFTENFEALVTNRDNVLSPSPSYVTDRQQSRSTISQPAFQMQSAYNNYAQNARVQGKFKIPFIDASSKFVTRKVQNYRDKQLRNCSPIEEKLLAFTKDGNMKTTQKKPQQSLPDLTFQTYVNSNIDMMYRLSSRTLTQKIVQQNSQAERLYLEQMGRDTNYE